MSKSKYDPEKARLRRERDKERIAAYRLANREKMRQYYKEYYHKYRDKHIINMKASRLKRDYAITPDDYAQMKEDQGGVCAICGQPETMKKRDLSIDHCHKTKKVRGLLCNTCNVGLGRFNDSAELVRRAFVYLARYKEPDGG